MDKDATLVGGVSSAFDLISLCPFPIILTDLDARIIQFLPLFLANLGEKRPNSVSFTLAVRNLPFSPKNPASPPNLPLLVRDVPARFICVGGKYHA